MRIASGGALGIVGAFGVQIGAPAPGDVSPASGKVAYQLLRAGGGTTVGDTVGVMLVQMLAADRLQAQFVAGPAMVDAPFTAAARIYVR